MVPPTQGCGSEVVGGGRWCMPLGNLKFYYLTPMDKRFSLTLDRTLQYYFRSMAIYMGGGGGGGGGGEEGRNAT